MILHIKVIGANGIPKMDICGKADPYIVINYSKTKKPLKTEIKKKTFTPVWNEKFEIPVNENDAIHFEMIDYDRFKSDDLISTRDFPIAQFKLGKVTDDWYDFFPAKKVKEGGRVHLVFHLANKGDKPFTNTLPRAKTKNISYKIKHMAFTPAQLEQLKESFDEIDTDNSGSISLEETKNFMEKIGINHIFAPLAFDICNKDPKDEITFEEFGPFYKLLDELGQDPSCIYRSLFDKLDEDNSGYLEKKEVLKLLYFFGGDEWDEDDAERFIEKHDTNGDGKLDFNEVCQMIDDESLE